MRLPVKKAFVTARGRWLAFALGLVVGAVAGAAMTLVVQHVAGAGTRPSEHDGRAQAPSAALEATLSCERERVDFGEEAALTVVITNGGDPPLELGPIGNLSLRMRLAGTDGTRKTPFVGLTAEGMPSVVGLTGEGLVLQYRIVCPPGDHVFRFSLRVAPGHEVVSNEIRLQVRPPASDEEAVATYVRIFDTFATDRFYAEYLAEVPGLRALSRTMPQVALKGIEDILRRTKKLPEPRFRSMAVSILGMLGNRSSAEEFGFERSVLPAATLVRLIHDEHDPRVVRSYLLTAIVLDDAFSGEDGALVCREILERRQSRNCEIAAAAYDLLVGTRWRDKCGLRLEDVMAEVEVCDVLTDDQKDGVRHVAEESAKLGVAPR